MQHKLLTMMYQRMTQGFCCRFDCSDALQYGSAMKGVHLFLLHVSLKPTGLCSGAQSCSCDSLCLGQMTVHCHHTVIHSTCTRVARMKFKTYTHTSANMITCSITWKPSCCRSSPRGPKTCPDTQLQLPHRVRLYAYEQRLYHRDATGNRSEKVKDPVPAHAAPHAPRQWKHPNWHASDTRPDRADA